MEPHDCEKRTYSITLNDTHQPCLTFVTLNQLRRQQQFCDIELRIGEAKFAAHQVILAASSPYLLKLISAKPPTVSHVTLSNRNLQVFAVDLLIEFLYTSIIKITQSTVQAICYAAKELVLVRVEKACCKFMLNSIDSGSTADHLMELLLFAITNDYPPLQSKCMKHLTKMIDSMSDNNLFLTLPPDKLFHLLKLFDPSSVIELLILWTNHDRQSRQQYLQLLIGNLDIVIPNNYDEHLQPKLSAVMPSAGSIAEPLKNIYVAGGNTNTAITRDVEMYDPSGHMWKSIPNLMKKRSHCSLVSGGGQLYLIGGFNGSKRVSSVDVYNPSLNEWISSSNLNCPRSGCGAAVFKGEIYVLGGYDGSDHLSSVEIYSPRKNLWREGPSLTHPRSYVQAAVANGVLFAVGGADDNGRLSSVEMLRDCKHQWFSGPSLTVPRSRPGVVTVKDQLFVCGGYDGHAHLSSIEVLDEGSDKWYVVANMSSPRNSPGVCSMGRSIYIFGGYDGRHILDSMEVYHTDTDSWSVGTPLTIPRCDFGYAACLPITHTDV